VMTDSTASLNSASLARSSGMRSAEKPDRVTGRGMTFVFVVGNSASFQEALCVAGYALSREKWPCVVNFAYT
jgi:hypothetical protein